MGSESPRLVYNLTGRGTLSLGLHPAWERDRAPTGSGLRVEMVSDVRFPLLFSGAHGPRREQVQSPI